MATRLFAARDLLRNDDKADGTWRHPVMLRFSMTILFGPMIIGV
jgi:hypothetical protein